MYKLIIFDFDGTLMDTAPGIIASLRAMESEEGLPPLSDERIRSFIGPPLEPTIADRYGLPTEEAERMAGVYRRLYNLIGVPDAYPYPYTAEILAHIRARGARPAIATLKHLDVAKRTLAARGMENDFDCVAGPDADRPTKAELIQRVIDTLGCRDKSEVLMLGDSPYDGEGARDAGVDFVAIGYGFGFSEPGSLDGIPMVSLARSPEELYSFIKANV